MKCLKCNYVSHDYLDACRKCGIDLRDFKREIGLFVLQPGVLDLSMVLGGAGADDLFANVGDEVIMHARDDDDFDISLDDYTEQPGGRRTAFGMVRGAGRRSEDDVAGMEHLTLELDASDLPAEVTARLRAAQVIPDVPFPTAEPPTVPEALTLPGHVTVEMDAAGLSGELPPDIFQGRIPGATRPPEVPAASASQELSRSLELDVSDIDFGAIAASANPPGGISLDQRITESMDDPRGAAALSGALASLRLDDVALAADTPIPATPAGPEVTDPTLPTIELVKIEAALTQNVVARPAEASTLDPASPDVDPFELSLDVAGTPPANLMPDTAEPPMTTLDAAQLDDVSMFPSFDEFELDTLVANPEAALDELAAPTLNEPPLTFTDEDMDSVPLPRGVTVPPPDSLPEGLLTSSDIFALEDAGPARTPEHLTLEVQAPAVPTDLTSSLLEDSMRLSLPEPSELPEVGINIDADPAFPADDTFSLGDLGEVTLPGHLTLELDASELMSHVSSIILDNVQLESPSGDVQAELAPANDQMDDDELLLDLDDLQFDDDDPT